MITHIVRTKITTTGLACCVVHRGDATTLVVLETPPDRGVDPTSLALSYLARLVAASAAPATFASVVTDAVTALSPSSAGYLGALHVEANRAHWCWIGTMRLHLMTSGGATTTTAEHTFALDPNLPRDKLDPILLEVHGTAASRVLGRADAARPVDAAVFDVNAGDRLVVCTDAYHRFEPPAAYLASVSSELAGVPMRGPTPSYGPRGWGLLDVEVL